MDVFSGESIVQLFSVIIGVYALYSGIKGDGGTYKNSYPKELQEPIRKILRVTYLIFGVIMTVGGVLDYLNVFGDAAKEWIVWGYTGLGLIVFVVYWIIIKVKFGKQMK